jgi:hypothetical protein
MHVMLNKVIKLFLNKVLFFVHEQIFLLCTAHGRKKALSTYNSLSIMEECENTFKMA